VSVKPGGRPAAVNGQRLGAFIGLYQKGFAASRCGVFRPFILNSRKGSCWPRRSSSGPSFSRPRASAWRGGTARRATAVSAYLGYCPLDLTTNKPQIFPTGGHLAVSERSDFSGFLALGCPSSIFLVGQFPAGSGPTEVGGLRPSS